MKLKTKQNWFLTIIAFTLFFTASVKAQVTIGDLAEPHDYSILELSAAKLKGGLRLPQLTTVQRDSISNSWDTTLKNKAEGLVIFNLITNCLEFWNGSTWISICSDILIDYNTVICPTLNDCYDFAASATIADLINAVGGNVYDEEGALYNNSDPLNPGTYYIEQKVGDFPPTRVMIKVTISTKAVSGILVDACLENNPQ